MIANETLEAGRELLGEAQPQNANFRGGTPARTAAEIVAQRTPAEQADAEMLQRRHEEPARIAREHALAQEYAREHGIELSEAYNILAGEKEAQRSMPKALDRVRAAESKAAAALEKSEAEREALIRCAYAWNLLLDQWHRLKAALVNARQAAENDESVSSAAGEIDAAEKALIHGTPGAYRELAAQLSAAKVMGPAFRRLEAKLKQDLAQLEGELVAFARAHHVEPRCLPNHLQQKL